jgi:glutamate/tyrosine decarboxylase-like PLP-dependent enzyme
VPDPFDRREELEAALELAAGEARAFLAGIDEDHVQPPSTGAALERVRGSLPERGEGALEALRELAELGHEAGNRSPGPRFFHFVIGGATPAALAADWLTSAFDQNVGGWVISPLGTELEFLAIDWLRDLFELPEDYGGVLTTGGTMANFVCLAAARDWCGERLGAALPDTGLAGRPQIPVFSSGHIHASAMKSLGLLGVGRDNVKKLVRDGTGRLDLEALERELAGLDGGPAIVVGCAGEVNAGDFDPIEEMADLSARYGAWLHVDGAFGLFARVSPRSAHLAAGAELANSVSSDGHKWLNVPHDCGFAFLRDAERLRRTFGEGAAYLPEVDGERPNFGYMGPEGSRRARAFVVWATLRAYGRDGYRAMVERHLDLARQLARRIDAEPQFERLADVPLNIVCFRFHPPGVSEEELDDLNRALGDALIEDGRVFAGTTLYDGMVAFRPAIVNWRTRPEDVDLLVDVLLELAPAVTAAGAPSARP